MFSVLRCFKTNRELARGASNLFVERIQSIVAFKVDVIFVSLKKEVPNESVSEILESLPLKIFSSMRRMLLRKIDLSSEKIWTMKKVINSCFNVFATELF